MPQLSLYLNKKMMKQLEEGAAMSNLSISKYVSLSLNNYFDSSWPVGYSELFGSIKDPTFEKPDTLNFQDDGKRENL